MLSRIALLDILMRFTAYLFIPILKLVTKTNERISATIERIQSQEFVFFTRGDSLSNLNKVLLYIHGNEHTKKIKIVTVIQNENDELTEKLDKDIDFLDREYPRSKFNSLVSRGNLDPT